MFLFKTAFRGLMGNGLKAWLTIFVLSFTFVLIIFMQGLIEGWRSQAVVDITQWEVAGGQYWNNKYDPLDPFTIDSSAALIPAALQKEYNAHLIEPILVAQGTIYPNGRMQRVILKGIRSDQELLKIPTNDFTQKGDITPIIIGANMAAQTGLKLNDLLTLRWRDSYGTFEATDVKVAAIFSIPVPSIDNGQIWLPLKTLQTMMVQPGEATLLVKSEKASIVAIDQWKFVEPYKLTKSLTDAINAENTGYVVMYFVFLMLAMIAIFDTQTLAVFRRQREIGTFVALGMTQRQVVGLFTLEGTMNAFMAILMGVIWGTPLLAYFAIKGISFGDIANTVGISMPSTMYFVYTPAMILTSFSLVLFLTAIVSYLPARKIAKMNPTDAIRGKVM